jgi:hypothetical protein
MSKLEVTRRAALGLGALTLAPIVAPRGASARSRAGGIYVDVTPLRANSGDPTATWVAEQLPGALARAFAEVGRAGVPVSVRVEYLMLGPNTGGVGPQGSSPDQMIGEVTVDGATHPLRATSYYWPMAVDQPLIEQSNYDRVLQVVQAFAYWAARGYWGT